jgi:hypothetical protein
MSPTIPTLELSGSRKSTKNLLWKDLLATAEQNPRNCLGQVLNVHSPAGHYTLSPLYTSLLSTLREDTNTLTCSSNPSLTPMEPSAGKFAFPSQSKIEAYTNTKVHRRNQHHPHRRRRYRRNLRLDLGHPLRHPTHPPHPHNHSSVYRPHPRHNNDTMDTPPHFYPPLSRLRQLLHLLPLSRHCTPDLFLALGTHTPRP